MYSQETARAMSDKTKAEDKRFYDSALWQNIRQQVLQEEPWCRQCAEDNIPTLAQMVDHIVRIQAGGNRTDRENLQPLCNSCHAKKRWKEARGREAMPVHIVCGPPGSGKSTWVKQRAGVDDLVVDLDLLGTALSVRGYDARDVHERPASHVAYAIAARDAVLSTLATKRDVTAWLITTGARATDRQALKQRFNADVTVLEVSPVECLNRIAKDPGRAYQLDGLREVVQRWWDDYQPTLGDNRVLC